MTELIPHETRELIKQKLACSMHIPAELLRIEIDKDDYISTMIVRFFEDVWAERIDEIIYPVSWWQAFKERWAPEWAKKRWPVEYKKINVYMAYPEYSPVDKFGRHHFMIIKTKCFDRGTS